MWVGEYKGRFSYLQKELDLNSKDENYVICLLTIFDCNK